MGDKNVDGADAIVVFAAVGIGLACGGWGRNFRGIWPEEGRHFVLPLTGEEGCDICEDNEPGASVMEGSRIFGGADPWSRV